MQSVFWMSSRDRLEEAAQWLEGLGCLVDKSPSEARARLVVQHDEDLLREVSRIVMIVDPAASESPQR